jgi:hypothetical protein
MSFFTNLLRNLKREGQLEESKTWGDYTRETYLDETGQGRYVVDNFEDQPRTIHAPNRTQYYANGEKQEFKR